MKKFYFLLLVFTNIFAQAPRGFYLTGGINQTSINTDFLSTKPGLGYQFGVNINMGYHETYNFQVEALYSVKNFTAKGFPLASNYNESDLTNVLFKSSSLDAGFYFNYYFLKPDQDKLFLGTQVGVNTSIGGDFIPETNDYVYLPSLSKYNFNEQPKVKLGTGFGLTGGYNRLRFDLRYNLGLTNIFSDVKNNQFDQYNKYVGPSFNGKISSISLTLSYLLFNNK